METLNDMPFHNLTNFQLHNTFQSPASRIKDFIGKNKLQKLIENTSHKNIKENSTCHYYNEEQLLALMTSMPYDLSLMHLNIRSFDKHSGELLALMSSLGKTFDIIGLTEIGRKNIENRATFYSDEYNFVCRLPEKNFGGAALLIKNELSYVEREDLDFSCTNYETKFIEIIKNKEKIVIGCIYRHPSGNIEEFTNALESKLTKIYKEKSRCIICGDLNIDALKIDKHNQTSNFFKSILTNNYIPQITLPTRITENTITLIDHIMVKTTIDSINDVKNCGNIYSDISDHLPNFLLLSFHKKQTQINIQNRPIIRIYGQKNTAKFIDAMNNENWQEIYCQNDPTTALEIFIKKYENHYNACFPLKRLSRLRAKDKKWITIGLLKSIKHKNALYKKYIKRPTEENRNKYKRYRNILNKCLRQSEKNYYIKEINENKKNLSTLWRIFGPMINPNKTKKSRRITMLKDCDKNICDEYDMANAFNNYFAEIANKIAQTIPRSNEFVKYLGENNPNSIYLHPSNPNEIAKLIDKLNNKKATGPDNIHIKTVKSIKEIISKILTHVINICFTNGMYPEQLKTAKVIPIHKKNDPTDPSNYRPISLLSCMNKIIEKVIYSRLESFLTHYDFFYDYQFGFRNNHSTETALIEIIDSIRQNIDDNYFTMGLYIDLTKAFDLVDHNILLHKLNHNGIRGTANSLFKQYLSNRQQYVQLGNKKSQTKCINIGVPQGSVLGPILFIIYVNDIHRSTDANIRLFADDTNIFIKNKDPLLLKQNMITEFNKINQWFTDNRLILNTSKTQFNIFCRKNKAVPPQLNQILLNNIIVERSHHVKYLGLILDDKLTWREHISDLETKLIKILRSFKIMKQWLPEKEKLQLYYAYFHSKVKYGIQLYGTANRASIKKIQILQNKTIKTLFGLDYLTPTIDILKKYKLTTVKDLYKITIAQFVHKQRNQMLPKPFINYFRPVSDITERSTRQSNLLNTNRVNTEQAKKMIQHAGAIIWNEISSNIEQNIQIFSTNIFKNTIKSYYTCKY